jgi:hypothetical protein
VTGGCTRTREIVVVDHTEPTWLARYTAKGRENGAATYSRDILAHQVPAWEHILPAGSLVSTCPLLTGMDVSGEVAVQYLHTYSYSDPLRHARDVSAWMGGRCSRLVFVTAYRSLQAQLERAGFEALFVPMTLDSTDVRVPADDTRFDGRRVVYFGNVTQPKVTEHQRIVRVLRRHGWAVEVISNSAIRGKRLTQAEAWRVVSRYRYGVGVGRCALEMQALGLRVLLSGARFGGLVTSELEWVVQRGTNWNGRVVTFDRDPDVCVEAFDLALVRPPDGPGLAVRQIESWGTKSSL